MAINEKLDLPSSQLSDAGEIWANKNNKELRYGLGDEIEHIKPMSIYTAGVNTIIKRGQPVSIGLYSELCDGAKAEADACVVLSNPTSHSWSVGLAAEPGSYSASGKSSKQIHIQAAGQFTYNLSDASDYNYCPPNNGTSFTWTYADVGKTVYVSNKIVGELTLDIADAYYNNGRVMSIGKLTDAPVKSSDTNQTITIEVQPSGDDRGLLDSTEFSITLAASHTDVLSSDNVDRLFFVKLVQTNNKPLGQIVYSDDDLSTNADCSPIGAIKVSPVADGSKYRYKLSALNGKSVVVTRLGIVQGSFGLTAGNNGKDLYLSNGEVSITNSSSDYEYKVGVQLATDKVLVDCRFVKSLSSTGAKIGTIRPAYKSTNSDDIICEPGFIKIDKVVHKCTGCWDEDEEYPTIDFTDLISNTLFKDIYEFTQSYDPSNPSASTWRRVNANGNIDSVSIMTTAANDWYFRFRDIYYTVKASSGDDVTVAAQIKYTTEGSPEDYEYLWPELSQELVLSPERDTDYDYDDPLAYILLGGAAGSSGLRCDITSLISQGAYIDNEDNLLETFDIMCKESSTGQYIYPGFHKVGNLWSGFTWNTLKEGDKYYLEMVTKPVDSYVTNKTVSGTETTTTTYVDDADCLGFTFPELRSERQNTTVKLLITLRRRPVEFHNLYLNQLIEDNPWVPYTDGSNLVTEDTLWFGSLETGSSTDEDSSGYHVAANNTSKFQLTKDGNGRAYLSMHIAPKTVDGVKVPITKIYQRFYGYKTNLVNSSDSNRNYIEWQYDLSNNVASLSCSFGANLKSQELDSSLMTISGTIDDSDVINTVRFLTANLSKFYYTADSSKATKFSLITTDIEDDETYLATSYSVTTKYAVNKELLAAMFTNKGYIDYHTSTMALFKVAQQLITDNDNVMVLLNGSNVNADVHHTLAETVSAGGIARVTKSLLDFKIVEESTDENAISGYMSRWPYILYSIYGSYSSLSTYNEGVTKYLNGAESLTFSANKIVDIYSQFSDLNINLTGIKGSSSSGGATDTFSTAALYANRIKLINETLGYNGTTYSSWPYIGDEDAKDITLNSQVFGVEVDDDSTPVKSESVEGQILGANVRLSYFRALLSNCGFGVKGSLTSILGQHSEESTSISGASGVFDKIVVVDGVPTKGVITTTKNSSRYTLSPNLTDDLIVKDLSGLKAYIDEFLTTNDLDADSDFANARTMFSSYGAPKYKEPLTLNGKFSVTDADGNTTYGSSISQLMSLLSGSSYEGKECLCFGGFRNINGDITTTKQSHWYSEVYHYVTTVDESGNETINEVTDDEALSYLEIAITLINVYGNNSADWPYLHLTINGYPTLASDLLTYIFGDDALYVKQFKGSITADETTRFGANLISENSETGTDGKISLVASGSSTSIPGANRASVITGDENLSDSGSYNSDLKVVDKSISSDSASSYFNVKKVELNENNIIDVASGYQFITLEKNPIGEYNVFSEEVDSVITEHKFVFVGNAIFSNNGTRTLTPCYIECPSELEGILTKGSALSETPANVFVDKTITINNWSLTIDDDFSVTSAERVNSSYDKVVIASSLAGQTKVTQSKDTSSARLDFYNRSGKIVNEDGSYSENNLPAISKQSGTYDNDALGLVFDNSDTEYELGYSYRESTLRKTATPVSISSNKNTTTLTVGSNNFKVEATAELLVNSDRLPDMTKTTVLSLNPEKILEDNNEFETSSKDNLYLDIDGEKSCSSSDFSKIVYENRSSSTSKAYVITYNGSMLDDSNFLKLFSSAGALKSISHNNTVVTTDSTDMVGIGKGLNASNSGLIPLSKMSGSSKTVSSLIYNEISSSEF